MSQFLYLVLTLAVNRVAEAASGSARNLSGIPCGQPGGGSPFRQGRIMGGTAADIFEFPYAVSLRNNVNEHYCAGSLVSLFFSSCLSYFLVPHSVWKSLKKVSFYKIAIEDSYGYFTTEATNPKSQSWPIFQFFQFSTGFIRNTWNKSDIFFTWVIFKHCKPRPVTKLTRKDP